MRPKCNFSSHKENVVKTKLQWKLNVRPLDRTIKNGGDLKTTWAWVIFQRYSIGKISVSRFAGQNIPKHFQLQLKKYLILIPCNIYALLCVGLLNTEVVDKM